MTGAAQDRPSPKRPLWGTGSGRGVGGKQGERVGWPKKKKQRTLHTMKLRLDGTTDCHGVSSPRHSNDDDDECSIGHPASVSSLTFMPLLQGGRPLRMHALDLGLLLRSPAGAPADRSPSCPPVTSNFPPASSGLANSGYDDGGWDPPAGDSKHWRSPLSTSSASSAVPSLLPLPSSISSISVSSLSASLPPDPDPSAIFRASAECGHPARALWGKMLTESVPATSPLPQIRRRQRNALARNCAGKGKGTHRLQDSHSLER